jgi:hypothetical protein
MRSVFFAAIGAIDQVHGLNGVVCTTAISAPLGYLSLW